MPGFVTVACKLPNGLLIEEIRMEETQEMVMGGGTRTVKVAVRTGRRVLINGYAAPHGRDPRDSSGNSIPIASGAALTHNVDKDVWDNWLAANKDSAMVRTGLVFASEKVAEVKAEARANETQRSGLEPMDPQGDVRSPNKAKKVGDGLGISEIQIDNRAAA